MKEYQFQYTKIWDTIIVIISSIVIFMLSEFLGIYLELNIMVSIVIGLGLAFLLFHILKRKVARNCTAKLEDTSVSFEFRNETKTINFNDLISYKSYYGKNGPVLYLKSNNDNFSIAANDNFKSFCEDTIIELDKYRDNNNLTIIHEGSIFTKKGMLYFLIAATSIYLLGFFIETKDIKVPIGVGGGLYLFVIWTKYFIENNKQPDSKAPPIHSKP